MKKFATNQPENQAKKDELREARRMERANKKAEAAAKKAQKAAEKQQRKQEKMAERAANPKGRGIKRALVVFILLALAVAGGVAFWMYNQPRIVTISLAEDMQMFVGDTATLDVGYKTQREFPEEKQKEAFEKLELVWNSSDSNVVSVENGKISAVGKGHASINVSAGNLQDTIEIDVRVPLEGIEAEDIVLDTRGEWKDVVFSYVPETADVDTCSVQLQPLQEGEAQIAEYDAENRKIRGITAGETKLIVTADDIVKEIPVKVLRTPTSIKVNDVSFWKGDSRQLTVTADVEDPECGMNFTYVSNDTNVVTVDANGLVTAVGAGSTTVTVTNDFGLTCDSVIEVMAYPLTYSDASSNIVITKEQYVGTWCYVAHVTFSDYSRFGTSCGRGVYGGSETTSGAAARLGAILTINGDWAAPQLGYRVARSGQVCNDGTCYSEAVYSRANGLLSYPASIGIQGANLGSLVAAGTVSDTFQFGPAFLLNGSVVGGGGGGRAQRTFIGTSGAPGDIWMVVTEGRYSDGVSAGLTHTECAQLLQSKGCTFGVPLDGGGSSTMVFQGQRLNSVKSERSVVDFVYFR